MICVDALAYIPDNGDDDDVSFCKLSRGSGVESEWDVGLRCFALVLSVPTNDDSER